MALEFSVMGDSFMSKMPLLCTGTWGLQLHQQLSGGTPAAPRVGETKGHRGRTTLSTLSVRGLHLGNIPHLGCSPRVRTGRGLSKLYVYLAPRFLHWLLKHPLQVLIACPQFSTGLEIHSLPQRCHSLPRAVTYLAVFSLTFLHWGK